MQPPMICFFMHAWRQKKRTQHEETDNTTTKPTQNEPLWRNSRKCGIKSKSGVGDLNFETISAKLLR